MEEEAEDDDDMIVLTGNETPLSIVLASILPCSMFLKICFAVSIKAASTFVPFLALVSMYMMLFSWANACASSKLTCRCTPPPVVVVVVVVVVVDVMLLLLTVVDDEDVSALLLLLLLLLSLVKSHLLPMQRMTVFGVV